MLWYSIQVEDSSGEAVELTQPLRGEEMGSMAKAMGSSMRIKEIVPCLSSTPQKFRCLKPQCQNH